MNADLNYYHYHETLRRALRAVDNPFAEPLPLPGNIQGGLGCFAAFSRVSITFRFR
ncbi:DUF4249 family protein [Nibrella viscosa]|uniref:DUF4249 family protein n=1 Tax=Nibrella viscosa TaxID=1084524 RepID=UPI00351A0CC2